MWIIHALLVHVLLLGSIFVIYFRSPVITGLQPQRALPLEAPAKRLVLIVTDGLRAESFFQRNCSHVPHILSLMLQHGGLVGVSHTRVPTESRPGHIALIAGLYEDPSAVTRGWKENPIDFDTLFNRSSQTFAWGANDVLHIFDRLNDGGGAKRRLFIDAYDHELDFSGRDKTYALDEWVFEHVQLLLARKAAELRADTQLVFFLHLLGLDSAGHIHKPGTELFMENLRRTDRGIKRMYEHFERSFPDGRTAYVLTSDHGMTNAGSHGAGDPLETETPFFVWGAGVATHAPHNAKGRTFQAGADQALPLHTLEQAQFAPLMAALVGLPPPMNNFGTLPHGFLDVSPEYAAHAAHSNAAQFLAQFQSLWRDHQRGCFSAYLRHYEQLDSASIAAYERTIQRLFEARAFEEATKVSYAIMERALEGIAYYHSYYRNALLLSTSATFVGWLAYMLQLLVERTKSPLAPAVSSKAITLLAVGAAALLALVCLQRVALVVAFYLTLPIFVGSLLVRRARVLLPSGKHCALPLGQLLTLVLCAEALVYTFFERRAISVGFLGFAVAHHMREFRSRRGVKFAVWLLLVIAVSAFPLLPPSVGYQNEAIVVLGVALTYARPLLAKARLGLAARLCAGVALCNALLCVYQHSHQLGISPVSQAISWGYLVYAFAAILLQRSRVLKQRLELIFFNLTTLYALFCTSYEGLFVLMLASELVLALSTHESHVPSQLGDSAATAAGDCGGQLACATHPRRLHTSLGLAFAILLYTFFSFFGSGNIASVSSFDPNVIRCFLTTFAPFVIMALVVLKLVIPVVLNIAIVFGLSSFARANEREIFLCLLLICDVMGLNFLFLVRNRGSWLEIGSSISHFVIMQVTTLVLLALTTLAKFLLRLPYAPPGSFAGPKLK